MSWELSLAFKATVVLGGALVAVGGLRRMRASRRHLILAAAFAALLVLPIAERLVPTVAVSFPTAMAAASLPGDVLFSAPVAPRQLATSQRPAVSSATRRWPSTGAVFRTIWMAGVAGFVFALAGALWRLNRLRRAARPWPAGQVMADALMREVGRTRRVTVTIHDGAVVPSTMGMLRPTILLPREAEHWRICDLQRVLIHEIEHTRRGDWWIHLLTRVICIVYWFHPLAWVAWRQLGVLAERACDDAVVARTNHADYAEQLVTLAGQLMAAPRLTLSMASRSALSIRVGAILNPRQARGRVGLLASFLTVATVAILVGTVASLQAVTTREVRAARDVVSEPVVASEMAMRDSDERTEGNARLTASTDAVQSPIARPASPQTRLNAQQPTRTIPPAPAPPQTVNESAVQYVIGAGDVLVISVWRQSDVSTEVVVRPDGKISMPLVNEIQAAGMTPERLRQTIGAALGPYFENPSVTVQVKAINSRNVFVVGQVGKPGPYRLDQPMTVIQLLAAAGGVTKFAREHAIAIVREVDGRSVSFPFDYAAFVGGRTDQNIRLMPGDTVVVP